MSPSHLNNGCGAKHLFSHDFAVKIKKGQEQEFFDKFDSVVHSSSNTDYVEKKEQLGLTMNQEEECDEETTIYKVRVSAHHPFEEQHVREYTDLLETSCQERGEVVHGRI